MLNRGEEPDLLPDVPALAAGTVVMMPDKPEDPRSAPGTRNANEWVIYDLERLAYKEWITHGKAAHEAKVEYTIDFNRKFPGRCAALYTLVKSTADHNVWTRITKDADATLVAASGTVAAETVETKQQGVKAYYIALKVTHYGTAAIALTTKDLRLQFKSCRMTGSGFEKYLSDMNDIWRNLTLAKDGMDGFTQIEHLRAGLQPRIFNEYIDWVTLRESRGTSAPKNFDEDYVLLHTFHLELKSKAQQKSAHRGREPISSLATVADSEVREAYVFKAKQKPVKFADNAEQKNHAEKSQTQAKGFKPWRIKIFMKKPNGAQQSNAIPLGTSTSGGRGRDRTPVRGGRGTSKNDA
jgi:hypothetical protein